MRLTSMLLASVAVLAIGLATVNDKPDADCDSPIFTDTTVTVTCTVDGVSATSTSLIIYP